MPNKTFCCRAPGIPEGQVYFKKKPWLNEERAVTFKGYLVPGDNGGTKVFVKVGRCADWNKEFCQKEVKKCQTVRQLAMEFNKRKIASTKIRSLVPRMAEMDKVDTKTRIERKLRKGEMVLIDEERLNSLSDCQNNITDTFMHFTYHASGGQLVVCDFKGANSENQLTLADTAVHSADERYGDLDNGPDGMRAVFQNHTCNEMCNGWSKPPFEEETITSEVKVILDRSSSLSPSAPPLEQDYRSCTEHAQTISIHNSNNGHFEEQVPDACQQIGALFVDNNSRNSITFATFRQSPDYFVRPPPEYSERSPPVYFERTPPQYCELPPSYWESETCNQCYHGDIRLGITRTESLRNLVRSNRSLV
ncbi:alpha-protein kinase vwkA-like [Gigantopelta aegis]|uniref:alpha-protein kinase vwkA-like n=1 Tax=Gigantopelta aegis TaxID=1735272 RepID=UPI001B88AC2A|nr:alpha-protein kinase vwkA-like [Gigantopelta aegis]